MKDKRNLSGFFCRPDIHTDEGYLKVLQRRRNICIIMLILGVITAAVAGFAELLDWDISLSSRSLGFYSGVGTGMAFASIVFLVRLRRSMKDSKALHAARIKATDERTMEISRRSMAIAGYALLIALYLLCLIGGLFYPELLVILAVMACVFLATYMISFSIYNKIM